MVSSCHGGFWQGMDNAAWGSHLFFSTVQYVDRARSQDSWWGRPMILSKFAKPDWRPGMDPKGHAESPSHHRYPVWWTGDYVDLEASLESMVDAGLYDLKPFVHSDCGGDLGNAVQGSAGNLIRWTAHCSYGSILRFHGGTPLSLALCALRAAGTSWSDGSCRHPMQVTIGRGCTTSLP